MWLGLALIFMPLSAAALAHAGLALTLRPWRRRAPTLAKFTYALVAMGASAGCALLFRRHAFEVLLAPAETVDAVWPTPAAGSGALLSLAVAAVIWQRLAPNTSSGAADWAAAVALALVGPGMSGAVLHRSLTTCAAERSFRRGLGPTAWTLHRPKNEVFHLPNAMTAAHFDVGRHCHEVHGASGGRDRLCLQEGKLLWWHDGAERLAFDLAPLFAAAQAASPTQGKWDLEPAAVPEVREEGSTIQLAVDWAHFRLPETGAAAMCQRLSGTLVWQGRFPDF